MQLSIRKKVIFANVAFILVAGGLWLLNYYNSHLINEKIRIIEKKEDLLNAVLEARRYEKNYFLTHDPVHLREAAAFIHQAEARLRDVIAHHADYAATPNLDRILKNLSDYGRSMAALTGSHGGSGPMISSEFLSEDEPAPATVPVLGREITKKTEKMVRNERRHIARLMRDAKIYHFSALGGMVLLSISVIIFFFFNINRPLKGLENAIGDIASGHYENVPAISAGLEFESLISSLNDMLDKLNRRNKELIQAQKLASLGTLTSGVAHELNNPLNNISTSLQILLEELAEDNLDFKRELLEDAEKEIERARDIVRALLEFSRQHAFTIKPESFKSLVEDTIKLVKGELPADVTLEVKIEDEIRAAFDFHRMQQVLLNLMLNGIQAMEKGGTLTISASYSSKDEFCFQVIDTGCGIPAHNLTKIFDPFFSTKEDRRKTNGDSLLYEGVLQQAGTGLGLAICHGIIEKHGGEITVSSELDHGTTFTICLPIGTYHDQTL